MRRLTVKQKKYIDRLMEALPSIQCVDDLTGGQWAALEAMNDTEILWQEADRYIWDKKWRNI